MIRGTTPQHTFTLPLDPDLISEIRIIYAQGGVKMFVKELADGVIDGQKLVMRLTQQETLSLDHSMPVEVQMRILTVGNDALASKPKALPVDMLLENEVME